MFFRHYKPAPPLSDFVDILWLYEGYTQPHAKERLLPTGTFDLVINLHEDQARIYDKDDHDQFRRLRGTLVCGAHSEFFVIDTAAQLAVLGVHFKAGGAFPFLKLPAGELHNLHVSLEDLWGAAANELRERLLEARTAEAKFRVLEQALLAQAKLPLARHPAVNFALREFHCVPHARTIADVTGRSGLSARRFIQVFHEQVGLTPKLFCRVRRFQQVLRLIHRAQQVDWADVALACGYFDQAHFIRDFQAFSGINPSTYLVQRSDHLNHVPLPD
jgi:AraC-like DNA-binding protein